MNLNQEELKALKDHAENYMSLPQLAIILEVDVDELTVEFNKKDSAVRKAIDHGRMLTLSAVQKSLITSAKNGSNPAQEKILEIINRITRREVGNE